MCFSFKKIVLDLFIIRDYILSDSFLQPFANLFFVNECCVHSLHSYVRLQIENRGSNIQRLQSCFLVKRWRQCSKSAVGRTHESESQTPSCSPSFKRQLVELYNSDDLVDWDGRIRHAVLALASLLWMSITHRTLDTLTRSAWMHQVWYLLQSNLKEPMDVNS